MPDKKTQGFSSAVADEGRLGRLGHRLFLKMGFQWSKTRQVAKTCILSLASGGRQMWLQKG